MTEYPAGLIAPPHAGAMIEALRGLGYSPEAALADIVDNSISAGASEVRIAFAWDARESRISIADNGRGMTPGELFLAMHLGARNPLEQRSAGDLGRFGMGLKTASFSQCRRLTVASRKAGRLACLRWDLDVMASSGGNSWQLLEGPAEGSEAYVEFSEDHPGGTIVLWETMDRIVGQGGNEQDFLDLIDRIEAHLAMVFHRLLEGGAFRILINEKRVRPWDPFMSSNISTWSSPEVRISRGDYQVVAQAYVLPHKDKLDARDYDSGAGPHGWTAQQGFYVYRNRRLLVAGTWLGLGTGRPWRKEEQYRLARLRLDIPNSADEDWKIDIRKSTARPPAAIRQRLIDLAEDARRKSRDIFAHRGAQSTRQPQQETIFVWQTTARKGGARYRIDEAHPAVKAVLDNPGADTDAIHAMLRIIEETVPVQRIWLDTAENREVPQLGFRGEPDSSVLAILRTLFQNLVARKGYSPEAAKAQLLRTEPFQNYPGLIAELEAISTSGDSDVRE